ncbi:MAG: hypothetical protein HC880_10635 [Bacteroidia bacterium]|nr:hypothetical protein [Bacteroidia bacterium]
MKTIIALVIISIGINFNIMIAEAQAQIAPIAQKIPKELSIHGQVRNDDYYWLNDRENPGVIAYLEAENAYQEAIMKPTEDLQKKLFEEIKGRIKADDVSVPYSYRGFSYYQRYEAGKEYPIYCRQTQARSEAGIVETGPEMVMLNVNQMAEGYEYYAPQPCRNQR